MCLSGKSACSDFENHPLQNQEFSREVRALGLKHVLENISLRTGEFFIFNSLSSAHAVVIGDQEEVTLEKIKYFHDCQADNVILVVVKVPYYN